MSLQAIVFVIFSQICHGTGVVLLQVSVSTEPVFSGDSTGNTSVYVPKRRGEHGQASPPSPESWRHAHGIHVGFDAVIQQNHTLWRQFMRTQAATKEFDSSAVVLGGVVVVIVVILGVSFLSLDASPSDDYEFSKGSRRRDQQHRMNSSASTPLRHAPHNPQDAYPPAAAHAPPSRANAPPSSIEGKFLQEAPPVSRGGSFDMAQEQVVQSLPPAQSGSRPGTQPLSASDVSQVGRPSSPHELERLPMMSAGTAGTAGATPMGSDLRLARPPSPPGSSMADANKVALGKPPPVCKELVLPHCEAWFAVAFSNLDSTKNGDFDLFGLSGKPLLRATIQMQPTLRKISVSMKPPSSPTLGSIQVVDSRAGQMRMQIKSKNDAYYGDFIDSGEMQYVVTKPDAQPPEVMKVHFDSNSKQLNCTSADGVSLARASSCTTSELSDVFRDVAHLEVRVNPGVDAVLALLCVLGVVLFTVKTPETEFA